MDKKIITRFAPSPTGFLHVGGLRTALYNYLFAKSQNGDFLLRIEDTDQTRKVEGATENLQKVLEKFGLKWDNNPPMIQSERISIYKKFADQLISENKAYYCFCTPERLDEMRKDQQSRGLAPLYDGTCSRLTDEEISSKLNNGIAHVIRFKMPKDGQTVVSDIVRGDVNFKNNLIDDQVILKSDGFPTYHLASVVDDHELKITHVIRGEEWLPSTPKHIALYQAFSWEIPEFAHLPLLLNEDKSKLSKRQGDVAVEDFLAKGYLPEALLNFVLLLGWNPKTDQEIFSFEEMIASFDIDKINKSGAVFNVQKLDWLNSHYIKEKPHEELVKLTIPFLKNEFLLINDEHTSKVIEVEKSRIAKLSDITENISFFFKQPEYNAEDLIWKKSDVQNTIKYLKAIAELLKKHEDKWDTETLENTVKSFIEVNGWKNGDVLWPLRFCLSGKKASPSPFEITAILGKEETLTRINNAINKLEKSH